MKSKFKTSLAVLALLTASAASSQDESEKSSTTINVGAWFNSPPCDLGDGNCLAGPSTLEEGNYFAWKQFLYMVGSDRGDSPPRLEKLGDSDQLFVAQGQPKPYPGNNRRLEVGQNGKHTTLNETQQAAALVPVVDMNGRWLHYSVIVNRPEWDYIVDHNLYNQDGFNELGCSPLKPKAGKNGKISKLAQEKYKECLSGDTCIQWVEGMSPSGCETFSPKNHDSDKILPIQLPDNAIELKAAWRVLETCDLPDSPPDCKKESADDYFVITADVDPFGPGRLGRKVEGVTMALVGLHILSKTPNRPDWIWTTFEYRENALDCDGPWTFGAAHPNFFCPPEPIPLVAWTGQLQSAIKPFDPVSNNFLPAVAVEQAEQGKAVLSIDRQSLLCTSDPGAFEFAKPPLYQPQTSDPQSPTSVCRVHPVLPDAMKINQEVWHKAAKLSPERGGPDPAKLLNYELVGAFWFTSDCRDDPNCEVNNPELTLSNTTMETFEQEITCTICHGGNQFNPMPFERPIAQGLADRSFIFHRINPDWEPE